MALRVRPDPAGPGRVVGVWAGSMRTDRVLVIAPGPLTPGDSVEVPLQTIDNEIEHQPGVIESCVKVRAGEHRTQVRFAHRVNPARFAVGWGVVIEPDGTLSEITAITRAARAAGSAARAGAPRAATDRMERAANIVTAANELARRAAAGACDAELHEIAGLLDGLLGRGQSDAA